MLAQFRVHRRAVLSNSNALHWLSRVDDVGFGPAFDSRFDVLSPGGSNRTRMRSGMYWIRSAAARAQVLFSAGSLLNVEAAQSLGMKAFRVRGTAEAERVLTDLGIIENRA